MKIKGFFRKRTTPLATGEGQREMLPLRIEGIGQAPLTPEPDDAELAAQALLEILTQKEQKSQKGLRKNGHRAEANFQLSTLHSPLPEKRGAAYYRHLAEKIRQTREHQRLRVTRFLAFVEQELRKPNLPADGPGSLGLLEAELYKRMDIVDREQGALKRRWQHCLAEVTVRLMGAISSAADENE